MKRFVRGFVFFFGFAVVGGAAGYMAFLSTPEKRDYWFCRIAFELYLHRDRAELEKESRSGESGVYYFTSYYLHGILSAVEATGSHRILRKSLYYMDNMVNTAVPLQHKGRRYTVWKPFKVTPKSPVPKPDVHYTLQAAVPLARAAAIIRKNPEFQKRYAAQIKRYTDFVKSAVFDYWWEDEYRRQVPWLNTDYVPIWNDNGTNMGLCALFMYQATGDPIYAEIAKQVGTAFQAKLSVAQRGWIWESNTIPIGSDTDNTPGSVGNQAGVPDTSHANRESMLMVFLHEAGLLYTAADIERMAYTFIDNIWNQSWDEPSFANYINGSDKPYRVYKDPGLNGPIYHGWVLVGGYSPEAQQVVFHTLKAILKGKKNPALTRNATGYGGMLGLTGHLLRNFTVLRQRPSPPTTTAG